MSESAKGKIVSKETREKLSAAHKGKPWNEARRKASDRYLKKLSEDRKGKPWSEARRAAQKGKE